VKKTAAQCLKPRLKQTIEDWVPKNRSYPPDADRPGPRNLDVTPYIRAVHGFFDNVTGIPGKYSRFSKYETCVLVTGTQSSKTEAILDVMGWRMAVRPRPQLYVGPSQIFARDQFEPRLEQMCIQSPSLSYDRLKSKKVLKYVNGVRIRLGWGGSATSMASDQAGDGYIDEYDKMFQAQRGQGDPYGLVGARGDTYADRKRFVTSTPLLGRVEVYKDPYSGLMFWKPPDEEEDPKATEDRIPSHVWRRWQTGTMHHLVCPCPQCHEYFVPRFERLGWPKKASAGLAKREVYMECPHCGKPIEERHKASLIEHSEFVAPGERILPDGTIEGIPSADTDVLSLWCSGLLSPFVTWGDRAAEYVTAKQQSDVGSLQAARNNCGEVFSPIEVRQVTEDLVRLKCLDYDKGTVPRQVLSVTLGVDVQGNRLVCAVRGWGARTRSYLLEAFELYGQTAQPKVWQDLASVFDRTYGGLHIAKVCIDAGFRPDKRDAGDYHRVLDFCRRNSWIAHACRGKAAQVQPVIKRFEEVKADGKSDKFGLEVLSIDTGYFKSRWYAQIAADPNEAMSAHFPKEIAEDYAKQIVSEVRGEDGKWTPIYRQNHYLDAEVLAGVGAFMLKVQDIPDHSYRDTDSYEIVYPEEVLVPKVTKSFADRMAERSARINT
jgi:phage terminase large subunit GpA-like protein